MNSKPIRKIVSINDIVFDQKYYPRKSIKKNEEIILRYVRQKKLGSKFPPIILAKFQNQLILVDGYNRLEMNKMLEEKNISAFIHSGLDEKQILKLSIESNLSHGQPLSHDDLMFSKDKLLKQGFSIEEVSSIIKISTSTLSRMVPSNSRLVPIAPGHFGELMMTCPNCFGKGKVPRVLGRAGIPKSR